MKVWLKRILIGLVCAFLVALVGIAIFLLTFDPNAYKNKLQEIVYARYERTLTIDGDIELSLFPRIGLSVQQVSLSDRGSSDLFASVESARLAVAIWPLMFNRLVVDHVAVSGFRAWLVRDSDGIYNFRDLLSARKTAALPAPDLASPLTALAGTVGAAQAVVSAAAGKPASAADLDTAGQAELPQPLGFEAAGRAAPQQGATDLHIDIAGLTLRNGQLHLHDKKNGYVGHITNLELNTGRMTADQPFDLAFRGRLLGSFPTADARFEGQALVKFNTDQKTYSAQRVNVQVNGLLGELQAKSVGLRGNLAYSEYSQMFSAAGLDFAVQGEVLGPQPVKNLEATLAVPQLKLDRSQAELHVEKLSLRVRGLRPDDTFQMGLDAPSLLVSPDSAGGEPLTATLQLEDKQERVALVLGMSGLGGNASALTLKELKLDGRIQSGEQRVQVNMTSPASWKVFEERGALSAMRGDVRIEHPALPGGTFEFPFIGSVSADLQKGDIRSDLDAVLSGSKLGLSLGVQGLDRPQVSFALQADQLDFNTLFPAASSVVAPDSPAAEAGKKAEKPAEPAPAAEARPADEAPAPARVFDLSFLESVDLSGKVEVGQLKVQALEAEAFKATVRAVEGKLSVTDVQAQLYDGLLAGQLSATAANDMALDMSLSDIAMEPFVQALSGKNIVSGVGTLRAHLKSRGMTLPALTAALDGALQLRVRDGAVRGIDVAQTLRQVQDLVRSVTTGDMNNAPLAFNVGAQTAFSALDADLGITKGQATVQKLNLVSPAVRATQGKPANIDLVNRQLDVMVNLRVSGSATAARDLREMRGVTVPLRVSGPFAQPSYQVQWNEIAGAAVREAVKSGLLELLGNQLDSALPEVAPPVSPSAQPAPGPAPAAPKDPVRSLGEALKGLLGQ